MRDCAEHGSRQTTSTARRQFLTSLARGRTEGSAEEPGFWIRVHRRAMACLFEITLAGQDGSFMSAARAALDEIDRLEAELSVFRETSIISMLNGHAAGQPVAVPGHIVDLLAHCQRIHQETGGAFDITTTPLSRCWGFLRREGRVPNPDEIEAARGSVGLEHVHLDRDASSVGYKWGGIELNLGAIGKGY